MVNLDERKIDFVLVASALMPKSAAKGSGKGAAKPSGKARGPRTESGQAAGQASRRRRSGARPGRRLVRPAPGGPDAGCSLHPRPGPRRQTR